MRWVSAGALRDTPLGRLAALAVACARRFSEPSPDLTQLGATLGALAPCPVAPARDKLPIACDCERLGPEGVKSCALAATRKLRVEFERAIAEDGYTHEVCAVLTELSTVIAPPAWGDMPPGLLERCSCAGKVL